MSDVDVVVLTVRPDVWTQCQAALDAQGVDYRGILVNHTPFPIDSDWLVLGDGQNHSFANGVNRAFDHLESEAVLLLSDDAYLRPGALKAMLDHDETVVGAVCLSPDGRVNHLGGEFHEGRHPHHLGRGNTLDELGGCEHVEWVTAACVLFDRKVIETVGLMDERYWFSHEDVDYVLRAREAGFGKPLVCTDALVDHPENGVPEKPMPFAENMRIFMDTWVLTGRLAEVPA